MPSCAASHLQAPGLSAGQTAAVGALQVLSDPVKRQIYDVYGKQGLTSGLELGERLRTADDIKAEMASLEKQKVCQSRVQVDCPCGWPALLHGQDSDAGWASSISMGRPACTAWIRGVADAHGASRALCKSRILRLKCCLQSILCTTWWQLETPPEFVHLHAESCPAGGSSGRQDCGSGQAGCHRHHGRHPGGSRPVCCQAAAPFPC